MLSINRFRLCLQLSTTCFFSGVRSLARSLARSLHNMGQSSSSVVAPTPTPTPIQPIPEVILLSSSSSSPSAAAAASTVVTPRSYSPSSPLSSPQPTPREVEEKEEVDEREEEVDEREHAEHAAEVHEGRLEQDALVDEGSLDEEEKEEKDDPPAELDVRIEDYLLSTSSNPKWAEVCPRNVDTRVDCLAENLGKIPSSTLLDFCETTERTPLSTEEKVLHQMRHKFFRVMELVWLRGSKLPLTFRSINPGVYLAYEYVWLRTMTANRILLVPASNVMDTTAWIALRWVPEFGYFVWDGGKAPDFTAVELGHPVGLPRVVELWNIFVSDPTVKEVYGVEIAICNELDMLKRWRESFDQHVYRDGYHQAWGTIPMTLEFGPADEKNKEEKTSRKRKLDGEETGEVFTTAHAEVCGSYCSLQPQLELALRALYHSISCRLTPTLADSIHLRVELTNILALQWFELLVVVTMKYKVQLTPLTDLQPMPALKADDSPAAPVEKKDEKEKKEEKEEKEEKKDEKKEKEEKKDEEEDEAPTVDSQPKRRRTRATMDAVIVRSSERIRRSAKLGRRGRGRASLD